MNEVKKKIQEILVTTSLSLILLTLVMRFMHPGYDIFLSYHLLNILGANIVIHMGLILTRKFESSFFLLELILDITYTTVVLIVFGFIFGWFVVTPVWVLAIMAVLIHITVILLSMARARSDAKRINTIIHMRDKKKR